MRKGMLFAVLVGLNVCVLGGCTVGPNFEPPSPPAAQTYLSTPLADTGGTATVPGGGVQHFAAGQDIPGEWWSLFHSGQLDRLIRQALANNPDLAAAQAALKVAMENVKAQMGAYYPLVTAGLNASRNQNAGEIAPTLSSNTLLYNLYQAQLSVSWTPDLWGGNKRQVEALQAAADAQRFQLQSAYVALTANVVAAAIQEASLEAQIDAANQMIADEQQILAIEQRQQASGEIAGADVASQQVVLAQARQSLPPLQKQLAQQRDLLTALAGKLPADEVRGGLDLSRLTLPGDLPVSLPSKLVEQRADVRAAEESMHMASAEVGVAVANQLPNITLSANGGAIATQLGQLFTPGNQFWSIGIGAAGTIFDGGTLSHRTQAARDTLDQVGAQYRSTVISAFQNVADALHAIQADSDALTAAAAAQSAASRSLTIARKQLTLGQVSGVALLTAQQAESQARLALVQAEANRFADTASLFQALGGGWLQQNSSTAQMLRN
jgi:NodT family efflux transporter outer membrane factor (OMF) lipoprotein